MDNIKNNLYVEKLKKAGIKVKEDEPMSLHTTFNIGGSADYFMTIESESDLISAIKISKEFNIPYIVMGRGSNMLVKDGGLRGSVIQYINSDFKVERLEDSFDVYSELSFLREDIMALPDKYVVTVGAGMTLTKLIQKLSDLSLGSLYRMYGIPGSVGGAIIMNAGAYKLEIHEFLYSTRYLDSDGNIKVIDNHAHNFGYRDSYFKRNPELTILSCKLIVGKIDKEEEISNMEMIWQMRSKNQPLDYPSGGSTFKRGNGFITSLTIDECGLKGMQIGGACVSTKHAGFLINKDNATANDMLKLINKVKEEVHKRANREIALEVLVLGEE